MNKQLITCGLALLTFVGAKAQTPSQMNDSNTPLHLMKPQYKTPYGIPTEKQIKADIDRVMLYIGNNTPAIVEDNTTHQALNSYRNIDENSRLRRGSFRLTSYEWGVTYSAMLRAGKLTADKQYTDYAESRMSFLAEVAPYFKKVMDKNREIDPLMHQVLTPKALDDAGAICSAMIKAKLANPKLKLDSQIELYADYVINKQQRLPDGNFARNRPQKNTVWLDDMFMGLPTEACYGAYLASKGKKAEAKAMQERAAKDFITFSNRMFVDETQLYRHGWVEAMSLHPSFYWARANGWALLTACELLDVLPSDTKGYNEIMKRFKAHLEQLSKMQSHNGFWHQMLDRQETYEETSATAIYVYCMAHAINKGWIEPMVYGPRTVLGWNAVATQIDERGMIHNTCVGTGMGFDAAFYAFRPVHVMAAHGYGPVIWAGAEVIEMLRRQHPKSNDSAVQFYPEEQNTTEPIFEVN